MAMKIKNLLKDKSKWTKGTSYRNKYGHSVNNIKCADRFCLSGALDKCYTNDRAKWEAIGKLEDAIKTYIGNPHFNSGNVIVKFNDAASIKFKDIQAVLKIADI